MGTHKSKAASVLLLIIAAFIYPPLFAEQRPVPAQENPGQQGVSRELTIAKFNQLHRKLTRMSTEKVWSIPWQLSVRTGRELAAKQQKPVFLWISSNGGTHPLGPC